MQLADPKTYLEHIAQPLIDRFKSEPASFDLAMASCILLYHYADVVGALKQQKPHVAAAEITAVVPKFDIVRALANAIKHVELTRHPGQKLVGLRADKLQVGPGAAFTDGTFFSDGTSWTDIPDTIVIETPDSGKQDVLFVCSFVLNELMKRKEFFSR